METDAIAGVKTATLILGFIGSALSLSYAKELTKLQAATAVATGCISAVCGALMLRYYAKVPDALEAATAFFIGLLAMRLLPVILDTLADNIKKIKFPWTRE